MAVRRIRAIAKATVVEILSEPLSLLIMVASVAFSALAPALHYHQFGDPTRMARDASASCLLLGGAFFAASAAIITFRREVESGTMLLAMAHSVSRTGFFLAKSLGVFLACLVFLLTLAASSLTVINGAAIGGAIAAEKCDIARLWGPSLAMALAVVIVPLVSAAALNRFFRFRFTLSANLLALVIALAGVAYRFDGAIALRMLSPTLTFALPCLIIAGVASAFAVRFRFNLASPLTALSAIAVLVVFGSGNDNLPAALFAAMLTLTAFLSLGVVLVNGKDDL